jgi:hypothetical protein
LTVYSLGAVSGATRLSSLSFYFSADAIDTGEVIPTNTGDVRGNEPGRKGEWRNGALTLQAIPVDASGNLAGPLDLSITAGIQGLASTCSGMIFESTIFWHWDGDSYHKAGWDFTGPAASAAGPSAAGPPSCNGPNPPPPPPPVANYSISATATAGGSISPAAATTVTAGADQTYASAANAGYTLSDVLVDGTSIGAQANYTFGAVGANHTIRAVFTAVAGPPAPSGDTITGGVNLNYSTKADQMFTMDIPTGRVDTKTLKNSAGSYSYSGAAASVTFRARSADRTLDINGVSTNLATNKTYTITGALVVSVSNSNGSSNWKKNKSYWNLSVTGSGVTITPTP